MIDIFETIMIGSDEILRPNEFELQREDVLRGEYTSCTGKTIADRIGWKYSDMSLKWDMLPNDQMAILAGLSGSETMTFADSDGSHSEEFIRTGFKNTPTRVTGPNGQIVWTDVEMGVKFLNVHND